MVAKYFESRQSFLTETAICIVERWKKSMGYRFVTESNHAQEIQTIHVNFFRIFSDIFVGPKILLPWQRGVTTFPLYWPLSNIDANMSVLAYPSNLRVCFNFASQTSPFIFLCVFIL